MVLDEVIDNGSNEIWGQAAMTVRTRMAKVVEELREIRGENSIGWREVSQVTA